MMSVDPLKSVISIGNVDNTSLALPSTTNQYRTGRQRVLDQVQTTKRNKSRHGSKSGSSSQSPTSPLYDSVFTDSQKSPLSTLNGSVFFGNGISLKISQDKNINRQIVSNSKGSTVKKSSVNAVSSYYHHDKNYAPISSRSVGQAINSRSAPDLGRQVPMPKQTVPSQRSVSTKNSHRIERTRSQFITSSFSKHQPLPAVNGTGQPKMNGHVTPSQKETYKPPPKSAPKSKEDFGANGHISMADITMKEAVEYLSKEQETYQHCGASFIQHNTFVDDKAKEEVLKLNGILPLVALLHSPNLQVSQTASAALRNLSFKNTSNKEEIQRCGGVTEAAELLRESDCAETQKHLTGLLWNLSSVDILKPDLLKSALPVLMECVILRYTTGPDRTANNNLDSEIFFNTTGCLRNLSSAKQSNRQAMRKCRGLVDSLVVYVKDCIEAGKPDDKSVENCVCILHNLTFQLEAEAPALFNRITALAKTVNKGHSQGNTGPISCFSPQSKMLEHERHFDFPVVEDPHPAGAGWLIHSQTLQSYLSLLESSQREETQEACCGTMQNLTAHQGIVSSVMSQTIVQKLNGLQVITPLLKSTKVNLQRNMVALVGNLAKNPQLQAAMVRKVLPELLGILSSGTKEGNESDDTLAMVCQAAHCLLLKDPEQSKLMLTNNLINSLNDLSQNIYFPKSSKAAALILYKLWSEKDIQSYLKKQGMSKTSFVNDITTAAHKSALVVD
ncbi:hypothetical protein LDENG_00110600 [Lucifuga dentata]|nr:hypothetical protein LDENG_00110600 [Lucifuga dentata]